MNAVDIRLVDGTEIKAVDERSLPALLASGQVEDVSDPYMLKSDEQDKTDNAPKVDPVGTGERIAGALFPRTLEKAKQGDEFPIVSGLMDAASIPGRLLIGAGEAVGTEGEGLGTRFEKGLGKTSYEDSPFLPTRLAKEIVADPLTLALPMVGRAVTSAARVARVAPPISRSGAAVQEGARAGAEAATAGFAGGEREGSFSPASAAIGAVPSAFGGAKFVADVPALSETVNTLSRPEISRSIYNTFKPNKTYVKASPILGDVAEFERQVFQPSPFGPAPIQNATEWDDVLSGLREKVSGIGSSADEGIQAAEFGLKLPSGTVVNKVAKSPRADYDADKILLSELSEREKAIKEPLSNIVDRIAKTMEGPATAEHINEVINNVVYPKKTTGIEGIADQILNTNTIPEGYYVHGRNSASSFGDYMAQMTTDLETAKQYAGKNGSIFLIKEPNPSEIMDIRIGSDDFEKIANKIAKEHDEGYLQDEFYDGLRSQFEDPYSMSGEEIGNAVAREFAPENIVNSAQAFDEPVWVEWLSDRFPDKTFYKTPDGAISVDALSTEHFNLSNKKQNPEKLVDVRQLISLKKELNRLAKEHGKYKNQTPEQTALARAYDEAYDAVNGIIREVLPETPATQKYFQAQSEFAKTIPFREALADRITALRGLKAPLQTSMGRIEKLTEMGAKSKGGKLMSAIEREMPPKVDISNAWELYQKSPAAVAEAERLLQQGSGGYKSSQIAKAITPFMKNKLFQELNKKGSEEEQ